MGPVKYASAITTGSSLDTNGNNVKLAELLVRSGGIKFGHFVLTSGKESDYYVDIKEVMTDPSSLSYVAEKIVPYVSGEMVAGVELGAVPIVVSVSLQSRLPYAIIRKERSHGTGSLIIGNLKPGLRVVLIEDVVTTGNSVLKAVRLLREKGAEVKRCICVVDREEGGKDLLGSNDVELIPLVRISDVLQNRKS